MRAVHLGMWHAGEAVNHGDGALCLGGHVVMLGSVNQRQRFGGHQIVSANSTIQRPGPMSLPSRSASRTGIRMPASPRRASQAQVSARTMSRVTNQRP